MNISAIPKISFNSNTPVYHVYNTNKDKTVRELNSKELQGPVEALVKRLNDPKTTEYRFFHKHIPDFADTPVATSTIIGRNAIVKSTVIYGKDAEDVNQLRYGHYRKKYYSKEDMEAAIYRDYVKPAAKKTIDSKTQKPLGLILYTKSKGKSFKLENIDIIDSRGNKIAGLNEQTCNDYANIDFDDECYEEYLQEQTEKEKTTEEYPPRPEELEEEFEDTDKYFESFQNTSSTSEPVLKQKLVQGELFDCLG